MASTYQNASVSCGFSSRKSLSVTTKSLSATPSPFPPEVTARPHKGRTPLFPVPKVIFCVRGAISPLLANIYPHYVFDLWAERWRRREATGDMIIVRYADDILVGFERRNDAHRFWEAMRERFAAFSLSLHPDKTRLTEFGRFAAVTRAQRGLGKPETFDFLGFSVLQRHMERRTDWTDDCVVKLRER